jgi:hypothetical protein
MKQVFVILSGLSAGGHSSEILPFGTKRGQPYQMRCHLYIFGH